MNDFQFFPQGGTLIYTVDYTDEMPVGATISSVAWTITPQSGSPLTPSLSGQSDSLGTYQSSIKVAGLTHANHYVLQSVAVLSNGESIPKDISLLCVNG